MEMFQLLFAEEVHLSTAIDVFDITITGHVMLPPHVLPERLTQFL